MKSLLLQLGFLLFALTGMAQPHLSIRSVKGLQEDLIFKRYGSSEGLPDNRIRSFLQDKQGFFWVGTMNGLAQYDGYRFRKFYKNKDAIAGNWIYDLCEDQQGFIWIGTREGLSRFDPRRETFQNFRTIPGDSSSLFCNQINAMAVDVKGKLWIGTPQGLSTWDPATRRFQTNRTYPFNRPIRRIIRSQGAFLWIATADGPVRYNVQNGQHTFFPFKVQPNAYGDHFWSLLEDHQHLYLATGGNGLWRLPYQATTNTYGTFESLNQFRGHSLEHTQIFDLCKSPDGAFWLGTDQGLARITNLHTPRAELQWYRTNASNPQSLSNNLVYRLYLDRTQVLWCGTEQQMSSLDLSLLPFRSYSFSTGITENQVRSIAVDASQTVWLGMSKAGLYRYSLRDGSTEKYEFDKPFWNDHRSSLISSAGEVWLGTLGGALRLTKDQRVQTELEGDAVFCLLEDSRKRIWLGTNKGLYRRSAGGLKERIRLGTSDTEFIRSLTEDQSGALWIGFDNSGLGRYDPRSGAFEWVKDASTSRLGTAIYSLIEFPKNVIWAGSESGLHRIQRRAAGSYTVQTFTEKDGLLHPSVNGIIPDEQGQLWISTIRGLMRFDPVSHRFQTFLPTQPFNYNVITRLNNQQLAYGLTNGFLHFAPRQLTHQVLAPQAVFTDFKLLNESVGIGQTINGDTILKQSLQRTRNITLNYKNHVFSIDFAALQLTNPEGAVYAYQMEGFDKHWIRVGPQQRSATYTNLSDGTYVFKVKVANSYGEWTQQPASLTLTILPPPWKTWWAIAGYVLLFHGLMFIFIRHLLGQARQRDALALEQAEKEQIKNLNQLKLRFFTDISHEFRTPLTLMAGPIEDLMDSAEVKGTVREKVGLLQRNSRKLLQLIDELMTFQKLEQGKVTLQLQQVHLTGWLNEVYQNFIPLAERKQIQFDWLLPEVEVWVNMDPAQMEKVLNNLLSNAFKCTPVGGRISLNVSVSEDNRVSISVEDTGQGLTPEQLSHLFERFYQSDPNRGGSGVGLSLAKSLIELHGGTITVSSEPQVGTSFSVWLPLQAAVPAESTFHFRQPLPVPLPDQTGSKTEDDPEKPELLLVDDNDEILDFLQLLFQDQYRIHRAQHGQEALDYLQHHEPQAIISDIMMPVMDGLELCRHLKSNLATCHIPLILLTARTRVESEMEGIGVGADDYQAKPFHPQLLRARVQRLIESRQQLIRKYQSTDEVAPKDLTRNPLDEAFLQKVISSIEENLSNEEFSVEDLGDCVCMSRSNLFRKLKALTGQTPLEFIYFIRLKHALNLLLERRYSISEITYEVGFKNPSSFSKSFRKQFGKAPTEYLQHLIDQQTH